MLPRILVVSEIDRHDIFIGKKKFKSEFFSLHNYSDNLHTSRLEKETVQHRHKSVHSLHPLSFGALHIENFILSWFGNVAVVEKHDGDDDQKDNNTFRWIKSPIRQFPLLLPFKAHVFSPDILWLILEANPLSNQIRYYQEWKECWGWVERK